MNVKHELEKAALRRRVTELEATVEALLTAATEAQQSLQVALQTLQAYRDASVTLETASGERVTKPLAECLTVGLAAGPERRN